MAGVLGDWKTNSSVKVGIKRNQADCSSSKDPRRRDLVAAISPLPPQSGELVATVDQSVSPPVSPPISVPVVSESGQGAPLEPQNPQVHTGSSRKRGRYKTNKASFGRRLKLLQTMRLGEGKKITRTDIKDLGNSNNDCSLAQFVDSLRLRAYRVCNGKGTSFRHKALAELQTLLKAEIFTAYINGWQPRNDKTEGETSEGVPKKNPINFEELEIQLTFLRLYKKVARNRESSELTAIRMLSLKNQ